MQPGPLLHWTLGGVGGTETPPGSAKVLVPQSTCMCPSLQEETADQSILCYVPSCFSWSPFVPGALGSRRAMWMMQTTLNVSSNACPL